MKPIMDRNEIREEILAKIEESGPDIPLERKNRILVVATANSGSTLLAELLKRTPRSLIVHEPFLGGPEGVNESYLERRGQKLRDVFDCSFKSYGRSSYESRVWFVRSNDLRRFCTSLEACTEPQVLSEVCKKAEVIIVKTVRLRHLHRWMQSSVDLGLGKVLHLVRDPRGVLASRRAATRFYGNLRLKDHDVLCQEIRSDLKEFVSLKHHFPRTTFQVRFEDVVSDASHAARVLYKVLGLNYTKDVDAFLKTHTRASPSRLQRNSTAVAFRWTNSLPVRDILSVQDSCKDLLKKLGYLPLKNLQDFEGPPPMLPRDLVN